MIMGFLSAESFIKPPLPRCSVDQQIVGMGLGARLDVPARTGLSRITGSSTRTSSMDSCNCSAKVRTWGSCKHAGVAARDVVSPHTPRCAPTPTEQEIFVALDVGLVRALTAGRPEQYEVPVERALRLIILLGEQIDRPHWDLLK